MLRVLVANDDVTPMEFVVTILEEVFEKSHDDAVKIMLEAHRDGQATCGVYAEARARDLAGQATILAQRAAFPLRFSLADAGPSD
ncbi:ATP-dependent Clp protease adaptor ClpS [Bradyrhizobium sp. STM 3562]|uniref:ATP-dependent Clp protease adaptor ClpS n=1 Tax=Bradyrhizobium sp. STM 3562 TaxID=578924 RepID=UPI00389018B6